MAKEYIEREALLKRLNADHIEIKTAIDDRFYTSGFEDALYTVENFPTSDVVEVVRCKDCKHFTKRMAIGMCKRIIDKPIIPVPYNHYCSYGEREEQG